MKNTDTQEIKMTQTQKIIRTYGRIEALAQAEEIARQTLPGAVAVKAVKASTSKAEREAIERNPNRTQWIVTLDYDLNEAVKAAR